MVAAFRELKLSHILNFPDQFHLCSSDKNKPTLKHFVIVFFFSLIGKFIHSHPTYIHRRHDSSVPEMWE